MSETRTWTEPRTTSKKTEENKFLGGAPLNTEDIMKKLFPFCLTLSLLLLAAHAARFYGWLEACFLVALLGLSFTRQRFVGHVCSLVLGLGALVWIQAGVDFVQYRLALGFPWLRLALIMLVCLGLLLFCLWLLLAKAGRDFFSQGLDHAGAQATAFCLCSAILFFARYKASLTLLLADRFWPGSGSLEIFGLSLYAAWLCGKLLAARQTAPLRLRYWSLFSMVFFLQLLLGLGASASFLMSGSLHPPVPALIVAGPLYRGEGYFMLFLFGAAVLLVGPAWCSHLCYIGAWDALACQARKKPPRRVKPWLGYLRLGWLALCAGLALLFRALGVPPWQAALYAGIFGAVGILVMLGSARSGVMLHCVSYCPMGALSNLLGKLSPWRIRFGPSCTGCGRCIKACRYNALSAKDVLARKPGLTCTLCGDCLGACENHSLRLHFPFLSPDNARSAFFALIVALHAVFLGVARI